LFTAKVVTHPLSEFLRSQESSWLDNRVLAMNPLRLNPVQPGTLGGEPARDDVHARFPRLSVLQHGVLMLAQPGSDLLTHVPGGIGSPSFRGKVEKKA
jgi:hypothetical protein